MPHPDPDPSEGGFHSIDRRQVTLHRIQGAIAGAVVMLAALFWVVISWVMDAPDAWWIVPADILAIGLAMALSILLLIWPPIAWRHVRWRLDDNGLEIRRGVFWKHRIAVPRARVQHADVSQGPLQRALGLGTLTIHTAGTQHASVDLGGLPYETALQLRDQLIQQTRETNVV